MQSQGPLQLLHLLLQPDHDRRHDLTRLAPGDTAYAQLEAAQLAASGAINDAAATAATGLQPGSGEASGQLWEAVTILGFQHGGHTAAVAAVADSSRTATVAVDALILTPWSHDPSGSDSDAASDDDAASDEEGFEVDGGRRLSRSGGCAQHEEYQPAVAIPHDGDAELNPVSFLRIRNWGSLNSPVVLLLALQLGPSLLNILCCC